MKILLAPNAYKGTFGALAAAKLFAALAKKDFGLEPDLMPVADGGDGFSEALSVRLYGRVVKLRVTGPYGDKTASAYTYAAKSGTALIEMARASGLALVKGRTLRPMAATSRGTGELIAHALKKGAKTVYVGLGGSATNDAALGLAAALGARLLDAHGRELEPGIGPAVNLNKIDLADFSPLARKAKFFAVTDVRNPLLGKNGSAPVYGPQKGATAVQVREMELALKRVAAVMERDLGVSVGRVPGGGAAGGLAAGLMAFCGAEIVPGAEFVFNRLDAETRVRAADIVVTGEGYLDQQTFFGKAPCAVALLALKYKKPLLFVAGQRDNLPRKSLARHGITCAVSAVQDCGVTPSEAMKKPAVYLGRAFSLGLERVLKDLR